MLVYQRLPMISMAFNFPTNISFFSWARTIHNSELRSESPPSGLRTDPAFSETNLRHQVVWCRVQSLPPSNAPEHEWSGNYFGTALSSWDSRNN